MSFINTNASSTDTVDIYNYNTELPISAVDDFGIDIGYKLQALLL